MQFINKRHLDIPTKKLSLALFGLSLILLFGSLIGGTESTDPAQSSSTQRELALGKLETLLLQSAPEDYAAALDAWRKSLEPTSLAGIVIEGPRGEVIASSGSFLDQDGRYYSTATSRDERRTSRLVRLPSLRCRVNLSASHPTQPVFGSTHTPTLRMTTNRLPLRTNGPFREAKIPYPEKHSARTW